LEDALAVLHSPRASFQELLKCAYLFKQHNRWDSQKAAAGWAIELVLDTPEPQKRSSYIVEAARHVVSSGLGAGTSLASLKAGLSESEKRMDDILRLCAQRISISSNRNAGRFWELADLKEAVSRALLLIAEGCDSATAPRLASLLRKLDRPDLVTKGVETGLMPKSTTIHLTVSYSAALIDMGRSQEALAHIKAADRQSPNNGFVLIVQSRALQELGHARLALEVACRAFTIDPCKQTAMRLAASIAIGIGLDDDVARHAKDQYAGEIAEILGSGTDDPDDCFFHLLAMDALLKENLLDEAKRVRTSLRESGVAIPRTLTSRLRQLEQRIEVMQSIS
jgi:tetratricopeptide (TPR) repeat protein